MQYEPSPYLNMIHPTGPSPSPVIKLSGGRGLGVRFYYVIEQLLCRTCLFVDAILALEVRIIFQVVISEAWTGCP